MKWEGGMGDPDLCPEPSVQADRRTDMGKHGVSFALHGEPPAMQPPSACPSLRAEVPGVPSRSSPGDCPLLIRMGLRGVMALPRVSAFPGERLLFRLEA